jgi:hypothetical protein
MYEQSANAAAMSSLENSWGLVESVQAYDLGGCCFSTYGGTNIEFKDVECKDNHCDGIDGRNAGSGLMFFAGYENPSNYSDCCYSSNISGTNAKWYNSCRCNANRRGSDPPGCVLWQSSENPDAWVSKDFTEQNFEINEHPIELELCFTIDGEEYVASSVTRTNVGLYGNGEIDYSDASCDSDGICTQVGSLLESSTSTELEAFTPPQTDLAVVAAYQPSHDSSAQSSGDFAPVAAIGLLGFVVGLVAFKVLRSRGPSTYSPLPSQAPC